MMMLKKPDIQSKSIRNIKKKDCGGPFLSWISPYKRKVFSGEKTQYPESINFGRTQIKRDQKFQTTP